MPRLAEFYPGSRAYGRWTFDRSTYETDSAAATTATVVLVDPGDALTPVTPVVTADADSVQVDWEYTLPDAALPGVWWAVVPTAAALVHHDEYPFRVLRRRVDA